MVDMTNMMMEAFVTMQESASLGLDTLLSVFCEYGIRKRKTSPEEVKRIFLCFRKNKHAFEININLCDFKQLDGDIFMLSMFAKFIKYKKEIKVINKNW